MPTLGNASAIPAMTTVLVPSELLETYRTADIWKDFAVRIISRDAQREYNITATAATGMSGVQRVIGENLLGNVVSLKVTGSFNGYDVMIFRNKMPNLHYLDLSDANVEACDYEYYTGYSMNEANALGDYAFYQLPKLVDVKLPNTLTKLGRSAFSGCDALQSITIPEGVEDIPYDFLNGAKITTLVIPEGVKTISDASIANCPILRTVSLPSTLTLIDDQAFYNCPKIESIRFPENLTTIGNNAFYNCSGIESIVFSPALTSIGNQAFYGCRNIRKVVLPSSLKSIGNSAFYNCSSLEELRISPSVETIGDRAFNGCTKLVDIYTYTVEPTSIDQNTFSTWTTATLHIPSFSHDNYYWNTQWSQFLALVDFDEPYDYFYINNDYTLDDNTGRIDGVEDENTGDVTPPNADLNEGSGFIVEGNEDQDLGDVHYHDDGNGNGASIIDDGNVTANNLIFDIRVQGGRWYFFSFPFDVRLENITAPGTYVFRRYDGEWRANNGNGGWKDLKVEENKLHAGKGYIFQCSQSGTLSLRVERPDFKGKKQSGNWLQELVEYVSEAATNAGWNFIGNPYLSYYDLDNVGYDAPVTRWNGTSYEAIRPGDDDYFFHPFEAFFVQKPDDTDYFGFDRDCRETYQQSQRSMAQKHIARRAMKVNSARQLVNIEVTDGATTDKTRVVFNDKQQMTYEASCDAAKFIANGVPQLFTLEPTGDQVKYAINERPIANGVVRLGYTATKAGELTISASRMDTPMMLRDMKTGAIYDLTEGDYRFETEAGTFCDRFEIVRRANVTGVEETLTTPIWGDNQPAYNSAGQRVNTQNIKNGVVIYQNGKKVLK